VQEMVRRDGNIAFLADSPSSARHIRPQGSDFRAGDLLLESGRRLQPRALIAAAAADVAELSVSRRPQLALLSTGDELVEPGRARTTPGAIPESISVGLAALTVQWGGDMAARYRLRDEPALIEAAAAEALAMADLVVVTGGASVGEKDFAKSVFASLGLELLFSKVAIKPGKPVWFGRARGRLVLGLPGNPSSALVTARLLLAPLVTGLAGGKPRQAVGWRQAPLAEALPAAGDRETFVRGQWRGNAVAPLGNQDSGAQKALADAELLIRRPAGAEAIGTGGEVDVIDF
jgi:molybdopterin molybdotransferase